jgi:hypothetical protein
MKNLIYIFLIFGLIFTTACGGGENKIEKNNDESANNEVKSETAKKDSEDNEEKKEKEKIFSDEFLDLIEVDTNIRKFTDEQWAQAEKAMAVYLEFDSTTEKSLINKESLDSLFKTVGYEGLKDAYETFKMVYEFHDLAISAGMTKYSLQVNKQTGSSDEEIKNIALAFGKRLKSKGYSREDLLIIEKKSDVEGTAMGVIVKLYKYL